MGKAVSVKFSPSAKEFKANGRDDDKRVVITKVTKRSPSVESYYGESMTGAKNKKNDNRGEEQVAKGEATDNVSNRRSRRTRNRKSRVLQR